MKTKTIQLLILITLTNNFISCIQLKQKAKPFSTIDSTLQVKVDSILLEKLVKLDALKGQAIVMEVQTGEIKAMVGLERKDSASYVPCEYDAQPSGLVRTASVLAAMETGQVLLSDTVDVGEGVCDVNGEELKDHNWRKGGYGKLTLQEGLMYNSNIAVYKAVEKAFGENELGFFDALKEMNFEHPEDSGLLRGCLSQKVTPLQTLTFYNAIANNGKMVQFRDSTIVVNPQIASQVHIDSMKVALEQTVINGLGRRAQSEMVNIAGVTASVPISEPEEESLLYENTEFAVEFCGYFPAENPQYSMIVTINKKGLPASGGLMAAPVFKQIAEYMTESPRLSRIIDKIKRDEYLKSLGYKLYYWETMEVNIPYPPFLTFRNHYTGGGGEEIYFVDEKGITQLYSLTYHGIGVDSLFCYDLASFAEITYKEKKDNSYIIVGNHKEHGFCSMKSADVKHLFADDDTMNLNVNVEFRYPKKDRAKMEKVEKVVFDAFP